MSNSLWLHGVQHARPPCPSPSPGVCPSSCSLHWWSHPAISSSYAPFSSALNLSQHQGLFQWVSRLHQMTKILQFQLQHQPFQWVFRVDFPWDWLVWSPCCSRDFQESSPAPQFKGTNSLVFWPSLVLVFFTLGISLPFSLAFHFSSQLFVRPPQTTILPFCISFSWEWSWSLPPVQCYEPLSIVLQALYQI